MVQVKELILYCFQHWPLDLNFEIVVETWLTAIQPWRYTESPQPRGSASPTALSPSAAISTDVGVGFVNQQSTWLVYTHTRQHLFMIFPIVIL